MFVLWYLVLVSWVLVTSSTPLLPPLASESQDYAELAQQSSGVSRPQNDLFELVLSGSSLPDCLDRTSTQTAADLAPRAVVPPAESHFNVSHSSSSPSPIMAMALRPSSYTAIFPVLSYSTILAIIGFISMRIAKWRQRRRARQAGHMLDHNVELLPTTTATISPRFRDLPIPPPLPRTSPNMPRSLSATSLRSVLSPRPHSPVSAPRSQGRLSRELERPKSPAQYMGFSPGSKVKRRSTSLDLERCHKKRHASVPTPLRRPFFVSEPELDHDYLFSLHDEPYRDYDDNEDETLIHLSSSRQREEGRDVHPLWHSSPSTPFIPSHPESALIDLLSSAASLDQFKTSEGASQRVALPATHTSAWTFDIQVPRTPPPHPSLPLPLVASQHRRSHSASPEANLIDFSPRAKATKSGIDTQEIKPLVLPLNPQPLKAQDSACGSPEGGDKSEKDNAWGSVTHVSGGIIQRERSIEGDVVDEVPKSEGKLMVGRPLSVVLSISSSSESDSAVMVKKASSVEAVEIVDATLASVGGPDDSVSPSSPIVIAPEFHEQRLGGPELETAFVEERQEWDLKLTAEDIAGREQNKEEVINEQIHDLNEFDDELDDVTYLAGLPAVNGVDDLSGLPPMDDPFLSEADGEAETGVMPIASVRVSLPPSPVASEHGTLPEMSEMETRGVEPMAELEVEEAESDIETQDDGVEAFLLEEQGGAALEMFPDPDLLPLPDLPLSLALPSKSPDLDALTTHPFSTSPMPLSPTPPSLSPHQIPTPPASPPSSPRPSGLSNITNRPAWSMRAADMPPLGIHANGANTLSAKKSMGDLGAKRNDENWDTVRRRKVGKVKEEKVLKEEKTLEEETLEVEVEAGAEEEKVKEEVIEAIGTPTVIIEPEAPSPNPHDNTASSPIISTEPVPGAFPVDAPAKLTSTSVENTTAAVGKKADSDAEGTSTSLVVPATSAKRRTTTRSPIDIALAMQLRPGLGLGADPAWMVRFLMAMFGWFVVLISGSSGDTYAYGAGIGGALVGARRRD
ncbi:hypothetical protein PQX77_008396 [Marasmius sp. AFHP31]|nr:hypothetical protein PQX77_013009 [Marasmius sp. AFHP31]KAK1228531.1 hypothetical protein PQX77_008396 [Marasmius sp. AFHP31]